MWRNGRRHGHNIRYSEKRGMGSNPIIGASENVILPMKIVTHCIPPSLHMVACRLDTSLHEKLAVFGSFLAVGPHRSLKVRLLKSLGSLANLADRKSFKSLSIELNFRQLIIERSIYAPGFFGNVESPGRRLM